jgi:hypothetical protein
MTSNKHATIDRAIYRPYQCVESLLAFNAYLGHITVLYGDYSATQRIVIGISWSHAAKADPVKVLAVADPEGWIRPNG